MKGSPRVLESLSARLSEEFAACVGYTRFSEMLELWGYKKLADVYMGVAKDEMKHAGMLMHRIFELGGAIPTAVAAVVAGNVPPEMIRNGAESEADAQIKYNHSTSVAQAANDFATAEMLQSILEDETRHLTLQEGYIVQIGDMSLANFLSTLV